MKQVIVQKPKEEGEEERKLKELENELDDLRKDGKLIDANREKILKIAMKLGTKEDRKEYYDSLPIVAEVDETRLSPKDLMIKIESEIDDLKKEGAKIDKEKTLKVAMKFSKKERWEYYDSLFPDRQKKMEEIESQHTEEAKEEPKEEKEAKGVLGKTFKFIRKVKDAVW